MSNLPPGVSTRMIDEAAGVFEPCGAQSPDGRFECTLVGDHGEKDHQTLVPVITYFKEPPCNNPRCPQPNAPGDFPCDHSFMPGSWVSSDMYDGYAYAMIARWPQRDDDFDEDGHPTTRKKAS